MSKAPAKNKVPSLGSVGALLAKQNKGSKPEVVKSNPYDKKVK